MTKTELGLGILSLPAAFNTLGLIPGLICLIIVGIITTWTLYVVGCFKLNHRHVYALHDAGLLMFGKVGSEILGASLCLCKSKTSFVPSCFRLLLLLLFLLYLPQIANSLCICRRVWIHRRFHWPQCRLEPCNLHCHLCPCCCPRGLYARQHTYAFQTIQLSLDRIDLYLNSQ